MASLSDVPEALRAMILQVERDFRNGRLEGDQPFVEKGLLAGST